MSLELGIGDTGAFLRELTLTLQILQRRVDDLDTRLKALEADRASAPGWAIDEGG